MQSGSILRCAWSALTGYSDDGTIGQHAIDFCRPGWRWNAIGKQSIVQLRPWWGRHTVGKKRVERFWPGWRWNAIGKQSIVQLRPRRWWHTVGNNGQRMLCKVGMEQRYRRKQRARAQH